MSACLRLDRDHVCDLAWVQCCDDDGRVVDDEDVSCADLTDWSAEFEYLGNRIAPLFVHPKSRAHARQYLSGLLAPIERKNGWTIAQHVGEKEPKALQRFLNLANWDADRLRDLNRDYVVENLADPEGVLIADPTGFAKKGKKSAGVQRQYSGTLGRVDNCQIGTFLAYVNSAGDRVLIDRELYIPEKSWFGDPQRCAEAGIPVELTFATRPQQVAVMIKRTLEAGVPVRWFTADEEFGQNPGLRDYLEGDAQLAYVMAVPKSTEFTDATGRPVTVNDLPPRLAPHVWQRRACGIGTKGYRVYDWAIVDSDQPEHQYMIRRSVDDGELAFYHCYNPRREPVGELVRVAGRRWPVEECFAAGKGHVGLDNYQVRLYHAWYRHVTLAMLAHTFLAILARRHRAKKGDPEQPTRPSAPTPATGPPPPVPPAGTRRHRRGDVAFA
jgi:SRSO17 transposase